MKKRRIIIAALITVLLFFITRITGPNFHYTVQLEGPDFTLYHKAPRTSSGLGDCFIKLKLKGNPSSIASIEMKGYDRKKPGNIDIFTPEDSKLLSNGSMDYIFKIPFHPWATKYNYYFLIHLKNGETITMKKGSSPMMVRFRGDVPIFALILHILAMFTGFMFIVLAFFKSIDYLKQTASKSDVLKYGTIGWAIMFIGGIPLGFMMNWYAFHVLWEAWPFGGDITDNKTQIALVFYGIALILFAKLQNKISRWFIIISTIAIFAVYLIPHSI